MPRNFTADELLRSWLMNVVAHSIADRLMSDLRSGKIKSIGAETVETACDASKDREELIMAVIRRIVETAADAPH